MVHKKIIWSLSVICLRLLVLRSVKYSLSILTADFSIWAREAGAGDLSVTMEGPGKAELVFEDRDDGSCGISYVATEAGTDTC